MDNQIINKLKTKLAKCCQTLNKGYTNPKLSGLPWLNDYCAEFLDFTNDLHKLVGDEFDKNNIDGNDHVETTFLCLTQIVTCIKHLESTIKAENTSGILLTSSRQHFLERINWCLRRLRDALKNLATNSQATQRLSLEENSYVELMDLVLDQLAPYSTFKDEHDVDVNATEEIAEALVASKHIRSIIDIILSHTLAFANVALKDDKKALSALCQKVLRECMAFQDECASNEESLQCNNSNRKLKAMSLENALYQLEDYLNEALLRLVFTCFLDFEKFSIDRLRTVICISDQDDPALDELIADFDVNIDRTTQIGIFAIAFAPSLKMKTIVRSCLASFESLDTCIIPSLQTKNTADLISEILEQHFNEEVANFKAAVQEIIDSHAFATCYMEMLTQCVLNMEKNYQKQQLQELIQMGQFLQEHFRIPVNQKELSKQPDRLQQYEKFQLILQECQAILMCADQVKPCRIVKRFKILRAVLRKFLETLNNSASNGHKHKASQVFLLSEELTDSQRMFESIGISPSIRSILYRQETPMAMRRRAASDSLKGNNSKAPLTPQVCNNKLSSVLTNQSESQGSTSNSSDFGHIGKENRGSVRRKESLRTAMFKRQKSMESDKVYKIYKNQSTSLHISEILDQLSGLTSHLSTISQLDESFASK